MVRLAPKTVVSSPVRPQRRQRRPPMRLPTTTTLVLLLLLCQGLLVDVCQAQTQLDCIVGMSDSDTDKNNILDSTEYASLLQNLRPNCPLDSENVTQHFITQACLCEEYVWLNHTSDQTPTAASTYIETHDCQCRKDDATLNSIALPRAYAAAYTTRICRSIQELLDTAECFPTAAPVPFAPSEPSDGADNDNGNDPSAVRGPASSDETVVTTGTLIGAVAGVLGMAGVVSAFVLYQRRRKLDCVIDDCEGFCGGGGGGGGKDYSGPDEEYGVKDTTDTDLTDHSATNNNPMEDGDDDAVVYGKPTQENKYLREAGTTSPDRSESTESSSSEDWTWQDPLDVICAAERQTMAFDLRGADDILDNCDVVGVEEDPEAATETTFRGPVDIDDGECLVPIDVENDNVVYAKNSETAAAAERTSQSFTEFLAMNNKPRTPRSVKGVRRAYQTARASSRGNLRPIPESASAQGKHFNAKLTVTPQQQTQRPVRSRSTKRRARPPAASAADAIETFEL